MPCTFSYSLPYYVSPPSRHLQSPRDASMVPGLVNRMTRFRIDRGVGSCPQSVPRLYRETCGGVDAVVIFSFSHRGRSNAETGPVDYGRRLFSPALRTLFCPATGTSKTGKRSVDPVSSVLIASCCASGREGTEGGRQEEAI